MSTVKTNNLQLGQSLTATNNFSWYQPSSPDGTVRLGVGNAGATTSDVVTVNSSGNLGLGVTPSAWSGRPAFEMSNSGAAYVMNNGTGAIVLGTNHYFNGSANVYKVNGYATEYATYSGQHVWLTAPSGTAGNAISFTQAMTLDASGNLLVGTTTAGGNGITLVNGKYIYSLGTYNNTTGAAANMGVDSTAGIFYRSTSSLKYKRDVHDYDKGLIDVLGLRPVYYKGTSERDGNTQYAGLIAEEVHEAGLTEFVQYAEDGTPDALAYGHMVSICIKAIQELSAQVTTLQAEINALKA